MGWQIERAGAAVQLGVPQPSSICWQSSWGRQRRSPHTTPQCPSMTEQSQTRRASQVQRHGVAAPSQYWQLAALAGSHVAPFGPQAEEPGGVGPGLTSSTTESLVVAGRSAAMAEVSPAEAPPSRRPPEPLPPHETTSRTAIAASAVVSDAGAGNARAVILVITVHPGRPIQSALTLELVRGCTLVGMVTTKARAFLRIGDLAATSGLSRDTLRHYKRVGLLPHPPRTAGGFREYPKDTLRRVQVIQGALAIGFGLAELVDIFRERESGRAPCQRVRALGAEKLEALEAEIAERLRLRNGLRRVLAAWDMRLAGAGSGRPAGLLDSLADLPLTRDGGKTGRRGPPRRGASSRLRSRGAAQ
jgi:MerR family copper efflux transcriptional regulator